MKQYRRLLRKLGIFKTLIILTTASILLSVAITCLIHLAIARKLPDSLGIGIAIVAPLVIVPLFSYLSLNLLFQLDLAEEKLHRLSLEDDLTGASNRRHFMELAEIELQRYRRYRNPFSIAFLDIDDFKQINDRYGHLAGDLVLCEMTNMCLQNIRESDIFARYAGDEFVILMPNTTRQQAVECLERIRGCLLEKTVQYHQRPIHFTLSMGVISTNGKDTSLESLLNLVDSALYSAKKKGKNRLMLA